MDETLEVAARRTPRLNLNHGFLRQIRTYQLERAGAHAPKSAPAHLPSPRAVAVNPPRDRSPPGVRVSAQAYVNNGNDEINLSPDFILRLIKDPMLNSSKLNRVAYLLVEKSCDDPLYTQLGAKLCAQIVKSVPAANARSTQPFVAAVALSCRQRLDAAEQTRNESIEKWVTLVKFLIECYRSSASLLAGALEEMLLEVLMNLTQPPCCLNRIEVDALYSAVVYCGQRLKSSAAQRWILVVSRLVDSFINLPAQCVVSTRLLRCIEIIASDWTLH